MQDQLAKMDIGVKDLKKAIDKNTEMTGSILLQANQTHEHLMTIDSWSIEAKKIIESNTADINALKNYRWWVLGFVFAITITGWFALQYIVNKSVETALLNNVKEVNYENK